MNILELKYKSGDEIRKGDHVLFHQHPADIELVADDPSDPDATYYVREFGGGIMILDPMVSGRTFIPANQLEECEDLQFVSRA